MEAIRNALSSQPAGSAYLVATGALTNLAELFKAYPEVMTHIRGLSIMGGAIGGGFTDAVLGKVEGEGERFGNYTPWAEFNIYVGVCQPYLAVTSKNFHLSVTPKLPIPSSPTTF